MKPKAQFGPLIRTDIGIGPYADISVKDQVRDRMVHRYDMYLEALRYRKLPSIESDIGFDPFRIIWTRYRSKRRNAAADGQAGSEPNGPNRSSGGMDGLPRDRPISEMILGRPSDRYRAGRAGGGESIRETICT